MAKASKRQIKQASLPPIKKSRGPSLHKRKKGRVKKAEQRRASQRPQAQTTPSSPPASAPLPGAPILRMEDMLKEPMGRPMDELPTDPIPSSVPPREQKLDIVVRQPITTMPPRQRDGNGLIIGGSLFFGALLVAASAALSSQGEIHTSPTSALAQVRVGHIVEDVVEVDVVMEASPPPRESTIQKVDWEDFRNERRDEAKRIPNAETKSIVIQPQETPLTNVARTAPPRHTAPPEEPITATERAEAVQRATYALYQAASSNQIRSAEASLRASMWPPKRTASEQAAVRIAISQVTGDDLDFSSNDVLEAKIQQVTGRHKPTPILTDDGPTVVH